MNSIFDLIATVDQPAIAAAIAADPRLLDARHASGASPIAWAAYMGKADIAAWLRGVRPAIDPYEAIIVGDGDALDTHLAAGWDPNTLAPDGFPPLALAAFFRNAQAFDRLLPLTKELDRRAENPQQVAAIHAAAASRQLGMVEALLKAGADPNLTQQNGFTPIHTAAQHGDAAMTGLLLLFGADATIAGADGHDAADHAEKASHLWLAERLRVRSRT
jgi:ankyrin repeat protein